MNKTHTYAKFFPRQPLQPLPKIGLRDLQQDLPACWCVRCGREVYHARQALCAACRKEESNVLCAH